MDYLKIELNIINIINILKMNTPYDELIPGKIYYIYQPSTKYLSHNFYRGEFVEKNEFGIFDIPVALFFNVSGLKPLEYLGEGNFGIREIYYEVDKIKENSKKARQQMEKRALDMILKSILNEDFLWL